MSYRETKSVKTAQSITSNAKEKPSTRNQSHTHHTSNNLEAAKNNVRGSALGTRPKGQIRGRRIPNFTRGSKRRRG
jgi:hypothetical protein